MRDLGARVCAGALRQLWAGVPGWLLLEQLAELLDALQIHDPVDLVGYSLGGATAANFTAHYPDRVRTMALISPVVYNYTVPTVLRLPIIGEFLGRVIGVRKIVDRADANYRSTKFTQHHAALFAEQVSYEGFLDSLLSMMRSDALGDYRDMLRFLILVGVGLDH